jgi:hypothetical protein
VGKPHLLNDYTWLGTARIIAGVVIERKLVENTLQVFQHRQLVQQNIIQEAFQAYHAFLAKPIQCVSCPACWVYKQVIQCKPDLQQATSSKNNHARVCRVGALRHSDYMTVLILAHLCVCVMHSEAFRHALGKPLRATENLRAMRSLTAPRGPIQERDQRHHCIVVHHHT